jgi:hypothetical protein
MPDPIHVEKTFQELTRELELVSSIRHRYSLIRDFIQILDERYSTFDSYLIQICSELPVYTSPITYSGMDPETLEEDVILFQKIAESVSELSEIKTFQIALNGLKRICIIQYTLAGAYNQISILLKDWYEIQISVKSEDARAINIPSPGSSRLKLLRSILSEYLHENEMSVKSQDQEIELLCRELKEYYAIKENSVLIPVVESYSDLSEKKSIYGRLRRLSVSVKNEINKEKDRITRHFNIIGVEQPVWLDDNLVSDAARFMLKEEGVALENRSFSGEIHYELSGAIHEGNSANAAIAALWFTGLQRFLNLRERYELKPDMGMTGDIDEKGNMLAVDDAGIKTKIEAVFFSGIDYFVVPEEQLEYFKKAFQKLNQRFPNRKLNLFGAENIREIFYDRRLSIHIHPSKLSFALKQAWQKKFETTGIVIILIMAMAIFRLVYGPLDQNPVLYSFAGEVLQIKNQSEVKLETIRVGRQTVHRADTRPQSNFVVFHDVTGNGREDIVWAEIVEGDNFRSTTLKSKKLGDREFTWQKPLRYDLDFPGKPFVTERDYYPVKLAVDDSNKNSPRLVISADHVRYFPGILSVRDLQTGEELSHFINTGRIQDFEITDLNNDGSFQIIFCGINNAFNMAFLAILNMDEIEGHSPLMDEYRIEGYEVNKNIQYVLIPKTVVGQSVATHRSYNIADSIILRREENVIQVNVTDFHQYRGSNVELPASQAYLLYNFDFDLNLIGVGTSDGYDLTSNFLYTNGMIDEYPDYRYFESYGEKLLYWDGKIFK